MGSLPSIVHSVAVASAGYRTGTDDLCLCHIVILFSARVIAKQGLSLCGNLISCQIHRASQ